MAADHRGDLGKQIDSRGGGLRDAERLRAIGVSHKDAGIAAATWAGVTTIDSFL